MFLNVIIKYGLVNSLEKNGFSVTLIIVTDNLVRWWFAQNLEVSRKKIYFLVQRHNQRSTQFYPLTVVY